MTQQRQVLLPPAKSGEAVIWVVWLPDVGQPDSWAALQAEFAWQRSQVRVDVLWIS